ncbi:hypothetical protein Tco_1162398 [Tanacetum coccineum]
MRYHILSPLKEICLQSLRRSIRQRFYISKKVWVLFLHLLFMFPHKLRTSLRVPAYLQNRNTALLQTLDLTVHDLDRFFNEVEFIAELDFIQRYGKSFVGHAFLQVRDMKSTVNSAQLLWEFKLIGNGSNFGNDLEGSNITRVQLSPFVKKYHSLLWRYFQHEIISHLKLKGFPSYVGIALLTITGSLDMALDLNNLLSCLMDDLWASEVTISNFSPADR